jgi:hypothetical protein
MNTQIFFIILVLVSFTLAYPQSAGNTLFRRGGCASGGVCLKKRFDMAAYAQTANTASREKADKNCKKSLMEGETLCDGEITDANAQQINRRFRELRIQAMPPVTRAAYIFLKMSLMRGEPLCDGPKTDATAQQINDRYKELKNQA